MEMNILDNGLKVMFYPMTNTHSVTMGLYIKAGSVYETKEFVGATHFLEHLHFRKCGKFSQEELYYKMERMGSTLKASTYRDFLHFSMKVRPSKVGECVEIFENIIETDCWTRDEFEKEKQVVINQILLKGNYIRLDNEVNKFVFANHSLSNDIMGDADNIKTLTLIDLQEYKKKIFSANNMVFCITGNINRNEYQNILQTLQSISIKQDDESRIFFAPSMFQHRKSNVLFTNIQDDNPLEINLSFDISYTKEAKDYLTILNCILGEGVGSQLQKCIREEKCYSSDIASYMEWYPQFAILHIRFTVEKRVLWNCLKELVIILNKMKCKISSKDLEVTLPFYSSDYEFYEDDTEEMNFQIAYNNFVLGMEYGRMQLENNKQTISIIEKLAKNIFQKENLSLVIVGNTKNITKKSIVQILDEL